MPEAVLVAAARSPIGRAYKGSLKDLRGDDLAATITGAALAQVPALDPGEIDDLIMGCGQPAGEQGYGIGRITAMLLGRDTLPGTTVQRYCASSLQSTRMAMHAIRTGEASVVVSAGVEMVSRYGAGKSDGMEGTRNPRFSDSGERVGESSWRDPREDGLAPDAYIAMGQTAENVARLRGVSREAQDEFAVASQNRAEKAIASGFFAAEITPVTLADGTVVSTDDGPRAGVTLEKLSGLAPVFREDGTVTAGNCCPLNDGAAALVLMSDTRAAELGITPLARIVSTGVSALSPEIMGLGPVEASRKALTLAGMTTDDVDLAEINEAFAVQVLPSMDDLGLDHAQVNIAGGAIALGHPFGMTGARMTITLLNALRSRDATIGLETMCAAGGQGMAMILERMS